MSVFNAATTAHATVDGLKSVYQRFQEIKASLPEPEFDCICATPDAMGFLVAHVPRDSEHYGKPLTKICGIPFTICDVPELEGVREAVQQKKKVLVMRLEAGKLKAWVINGAVMAGLYVPYEPPKEKTKAELMDEYRRRHSHCPECGQSDYSTTCVGSFIFDLETFVNRNHVSCACGWRGIQHDMVAKPEGG